MRRIRICGGTQVIKIIFEDKKIDGLLLQPPHWGCFTWYLCWQWCYLNKHWALLMLTMFLMLKNFGGFYLNLSLLPIELTLVLTLMLTLTKILLLNLMLIWNNFVWFFFAGERNLPSFSPSHWADACAEYDAQADSHAEKNAHADNDADLKETSDAFYFKVSANSPLSLLPTEGDRLVYSNTRWMFNTSKIFRDAVL